VCRDGAGKTKAHLELNMMRDTKCNKKGFKCIGNKRKAKENMGLLLNGTEGSFL